MKADVLTLPDDPEFLKIRLNESVETIKEKNLKIEEKDRRIRLLEEQLRLAKPAITQSI